MKITFNKAIQEAKKQGITVVLEAVIDDDYELDDFVFSVYKNGEVIYGNVKYDTIRAFMFGYATNKED